MPLLMCDINLTEEALLRQLEAGSPSPRSHAMTWRTGEEESAGIRAVGCGLLHNKQGSGQLPVPCEARGA